MKASAEVRRWVNRRRHNGGKKNGVISWLWDAPQMEMKIAKNKRIVRRQDRLPHADAY